VFAYGEGLVAGIGMLDFKRFDQAHETPTVNAMTTLDRIGQCSCKRGKDRPDHDRNRDTCGEKSRR